MHGTLLCGTLELPVERINSGWKLGRLGKYVQSLPGILIHYVAKLPSMKGEGTMDLTKVDAHRISIENKYLGGDVEHIQLGKGLDYALLHKVRSEKPENEDSTDGKSRTWKVRAFIL
eukprot:Gb_03628 [translate_table: standard]